MNPHDDLRRATEALLPDDASLSAAEVAELLTAAGADPAALTVRAQASIPLESCAAFQALLPAYRAGTLAAARRLLVEDHLHQCVACRHALHPSAVATPLPAPSSVSPRRRVPAWAYAAAAVVIAVAVIGFAGRADLLPGQSPALATLTASGGGAFAVSGAAVAPASSGYVLDTGARLRTGSRPGAELALRDGTRLELGRRTEVSLVRGWTGITVHLLSGEMIVRAQPQPWGRRLYVATADSRIADQGTIFSVAHGLLGSRVAVAEGRVAFTFEHNGRELRQTVLAGQEATSDSRLALVPVQDAFNWSSNAGQYLALLGELSSLDKQLESLASPPPRYHSELVGLVPANAFIYAAIPNLNLTLGQVQQILQSDLTSNSALSAFWNQADKSGQTNGQQIQGMLNRLQQITGFLGDEFALAAAADPKPGLVMLASVAKPGLPAALAHLPAAPHAPALQVLTSPNAAGTGFSRSLLVWIGNGKLIASHNGALLQVCAALAQTSTPGPFLQSTLYQKIAPLYQSGANWILAADVNQLRLLHVHAKVSSAAQPASHITYVVARTQLRNSGTPTSIEVDFSGPRSGLAGVLAAPGPMGGLAFISPQASFAASFLTQSPAQLMTVMHGDHHKTSSSPSPSPQKQALRQDQTNLASTLGGEFTLAQDGPIVPTPGWKAAIEVNDSLATQADIAQLVHDINAAAPANKQLTINQQTSNSYTIRVLTQGGAAQPVLAYTFAGSYLLAGSSVSEVEDGLQSYASGTGLAASSQFQSLLPQNSQSNFSALIYHNLNQSLAPLVAKLVPSVPANWQSAVQALLTNSTPGLSYVYARPSSLELASSRGLLGLTLSDLLALQLHSNRRLKAPQ
ncbi:MAG: FecR domain-containing protein [Terriglobales bacterium]